MRIFALGMSLAAARCGACKSPTPGTDAGTKTIASAVATLASAPLSLPISADHDENRNVYVAGFVAARSAIDLSRYDDQGRLAWNSDVLTKLAFSSDAHIDVLATSHGAVVVWRGIRNGKRTRVGVYVADDGKPGGPFAVGASACVASNTLLAIAGNGASIHARRLPDAADKKVVSISDGRDATLVCGPAKRAFVIDEGEDDIGVRAIEDGAARPRALLVGLDDLGDDQIREHEDFTIGDVLGQMLLTEAGHLILRQYTDSPSARRPLEPVIGPDEDLMAVDGNPSRVVALVSREAGGRCDGDIGTDVLAVDVPLPAGQARTLEISRGACGHDLGPYWVAPTDSAVYVAWVVRGPRVGNRAPVEALAWAKIDGAVNEVKMSAEDVVFAGCAKEHCMFAALDRPEGTDGMTPGAARIIAIP